MNEPLPLARIHEAALRFLRHRDDAALFGAQAVNAYVEEARMTQDIDILSPRAADLARELREHLADQFKIAVRVREVAGGKGFRIFQLRSPRNRHLADVRQVHQLPPTRLVAGVRVATPEELIARKVISCTRRGAQPKGDTDRRDLKVLLLAHPDLKARSGPVLERLRANSADPAAMRLWNRLVQLRIEQESEDDWSE